MKKTVKRIVLFLLTVSLCCLISMRTLAKEEVPDLSRTGSISITMKNTETAEIVPGGSVNLYRVADAVENDWDYSFQFTDTFADCGLSLEDIQSETLAYRLSVYAKKNGLSAETRNVGTNGTVLFTGLAPGLYLTVQSSAAEGYEAVRPFLVSVPMKEAEGGRWIYDVDASPKVELKKAQKPNTGDGASGNTSGKYGALLPQTGQLNWPVPVLTIAGLLLFAFGWKLNRESKE